ncbi:MAG: hypothetical protein ACYTKD_27150, partial [Planctomycetota bacterium]
MGTKLAAQAGIRSLGRVGDQGSLVKLDSLLGDAHWARYAADALAESASDDVALALIEAYPAYARDVAQRKPKTVPPDDRPGFEAVDRAYETPHAIASALSRMPLKDARVIEGLRRIAPLLVANLPGDFDGAMLYEPEGHQLIVAFLLERAGVREEVCDVALEALGKGGGADGAGKETLTPEQRKALLALGRKAPGGISVAATWLPALSRPGERTRALVGLLDHANGWARINAAKALMFTGERSAAARIAELLAASRSEGAYGYFGKFLYIHEGRSQQQHSPLPWRRLLLRRAIRTSERPPPSVSPVGLRTSACESRPRIQVRRSRSGLDISSVDMQPSERRGQPFIGAGVPNGARIGHAREDLLLPMNSVGTHTGKEEVSCPLLSS